MSGLIPAWLPAALERAQWGFVAYFLSVNALYMVLFAISFHAVLEHLRHMGYRDLGEILRSKLAPPVSVLIPARNEEASIVSSVQSIFQLTYPEFEIVVVNDGSSDETLAKLAAAFSLRKTKWVYHKTLPTANVRAIYVSSLSARWARLVVVDKERGGKADALNAGINVSRYPLFCSVDADSMLERDSLLRVVIPFMERFAETTGVGGIVRVANGCWISQGIVRIVQVSKRWLPRFQTVEYLRAFLSGRVAWSRIKSLLIISGAFGLFKKSAVLEAGGYDASTVGEDMELVVRLHHRLRAKGRGCHIEFIPDTVCWTEAPEKFRALWRQRNRWQRGLGQALDRHRGMALNPRFGVIGLLAVPYFWLVEFLSPVIETFGGATFLLALAAGAVNWKAFSSFFLLTVLMGINFSLFAVLLEEFTLRRYTRVRDLMRLLAGSILENLGYRQFLNLARLHGLFDFARSSNVWGALEKEGLQAR